MALSFPYPSSGGEIRPAGNGCVGSCVHRVYCPAYYWLERYQNRKDIQSATLGTNCASWSGDPADRIIGVNSDDIAQNDRLNDEGILTEADTGGIVEPTTGGRWRDES
jgi:hypothetical protein